MDSGKSYSPSYGWRSIISARSLVKKGLIKRIGSGDSISVWNDPWVPAQFPRPALSNGSLMDPSSKIQQFIDPQTNTWDLSRLETCFDPADAYLISAIPIGNRNEPDSFGWHFSKTGKYTVRSGYHTARLQNPNTDLPRVFGPDWTPLQAHVWKIKCPPKIKHFMWQALSGCIPVLSNLSGRGINCDLTCVRCGHCEETVNHVLFECPPARQAWALSQVSSGLQIFPTPSVYTNFDYLFWRQPAQLHNDSFPWVLWYIWKARNSKVYANVDESPEDIIRLANAETTTWMQAQVEAEWETPPFVGSLHSHPPRANPLPVVFTGHRCFVDGSWKETDKFAGMGWHCTDYEGTISRGAANLRRSLSPLHAEVEALVWSIRCMIGAGKEHVSFLTDCSDLVKMVYAPQEWPAFSVYMDAIKSDMEEFLSFSLSLIPRNKNAKADNLARHVRTLPQHVTYVNNVPPNWLS